MSPHEELFCRLLDESSALLGAGDNASIAIPDDELHREIIVPLLPAMLGDKQIRQHWSEQAATGFPARLARHLDGGEPAPRWLPDDFEIHVTASYSAGADARALADTLLSEESLRDLTAALMNQLLDALWPSLAPAPAEPKAAIGVPVEEIPVTEAMTPAEVPSAAGIPVPPPVVKAGPEILPSVLEPEYAEKIQQSETQAPPEAASRALIRALCGQISAGAVRRGLAANSAPPGASAAIIARRILQRAPRATSPRRLPRRASL